MIYKDTLFHTIPITAYSCIVDERKKGPEHSPGPFSIALLHNLIFIDTRDKSGTGFFEVNLSGGVNEAMYKSRSYVKMRIWPRFSAQAFRNQADNRPNRRDLYMESSFCRCFPVQARLVQEPSSANEPSQDITKTPRIPARRLERKTRLELFLVTHWKSAI